MAPQKATGSQPGLQFDFQSSAHTKRESRNQYFSTHKQSVARRGRQPTDKASHSVEEPREQSQPYYQIYHLGIIDYLQDWSFSKKSERWLKTLQNTSNLKNVSAQPPDPYQSRFVDFVSRNVLKPAVEHNDSGMSFEEYKAQFIRQLVSDL